ncbi:hypothetical protein [Komagataeibacter sp. FNDCF1]|uniref:hypothetical protein n=1 Tax=Komagataeibacter sp. FNDCF1 TaxID=2878681 RepID=UPI001E4E420A|nr:hypothetical protein [Komagataeibacter sp. FNDCF1]MCE2564098.1 hypothetical protein [Komagataeibacter sp. FNDCF1]
MLSSLFPQWMPPWAQAVLLVGGVLLALVWLLVPFAVFGVKGRLDGLAIQIDDLQAELRVLAMGLNAPAAPPAASPAGPEPLADAPSPRHAQPAAPLWEPEPPRPATMPARPDHAEGDSDIPAYARRAPHAPRQPAATAPPAMPLRPEPAEPPRVRDVAEEWPSRPVAPAAPAHPPEPLRAERDAGPALSEWSRGPARTTAREAAAAAHRPVRASVWPPERGSRAEPTLRWPPRPDA